MTARPSDPIKRIEIMSQIKTTKGAAVPAPKNNAWPPAKQIVMNILNGLALGAVVSLIPGALMGGILKLIIPSAPWLQPILTATLLSNAAMGLVVGVMTGIFFKFSPIQSASIGLAVFVGGGVLKGVGEGGKGLLLAGTGDVINMGITSAIAVLLTLWLGNRFKAYTILLMPLLNVLVAGGIGLMTLPYVSMITGAIGKFVASLTSLQPILMGVLLAVVFAAMIVSPITTVGIALAISLSGVGSAAANIGICACGFGFAIAGWKVNTHGNSLAHFIGSPKMSMANVLSRPKILVPILCAAAVSGLFAPILGVKGTPMSAGFGFSGLVGPLASFETGGWGAMNVLNTILAFAVIPAVSAWFFVWLFQTKLKFVTPEDYYIEAQ